MKRFLLPLLAFSLLTAAARSAPDPRFDRWYVVMLADRQVGYSRTSLEETGDEFTTTIDTRISLRRGRVTLDVVQHQTFIETADGRPVRAASRLKMGQMDLTQEITFLEDGGGLEVVTTQGDQTRKRTLPPFETEWTPPAETQRTIERQMAAGAERISVRSLDVTMAPQLVDVVMSVIGPRKIEVSGRAVEAIAWDMTQSLMPGISVREFVDPSGRPLLTTISLIPGMDLKMIMADRNVALAEVDPPEMMASTLVRPDRPIERPRELRTAVYELHLEPQRKGMRVDLPRAGYQRVVWGDRDTARVVVDLSEPVNPIGDLPTDADRLPSDMLNSDDPEVRRLLGEALGEEAGSLDPPARARRLRRFVHRYVDAKDLSVGFATASEVARTAQGDCTEHAVLLATMLRAADVPARTVSGLIYVDRFLDRDTVFGYHMWTQAWLPSPRGASWVDLDATLADAPFDAAHIALVISSMARGSTLNDMAALLPLLGQIEVKVIEAEGPR